MKSHRILVLLLTAGLLAVLTGGAGAQGPVAPGNVGAQAALGTSFTYQGRLNEGDVPAEGSYDFRFTLYDAAFEGSQVGRTVLRENVLVAEGYFAVELDFGGAAFTGDARYLEVGVRPGDSTAALA